MTLRRHTLPALAVLLAPPVLLLAVFFLWPVANILAISLTEPAPGLGNYAQLFENPALRRIFVTTIRIAGITTILSVAIGYLVAWRMREAGLRELRLILFCLMFPLWTSVLVRAFAWVILLQRNGLLNDLLLGLGIIEVPLALVRNETGVLIGMVHVMIPFATLPIYAAMRGLDPLLLQASRSLGATPLRSFLHVFFPLTLPGVGAASVLVFITSMGFYVTPVVLGGGRVVMIAEYISVQVTETLRWGLGAMLATLLLFVVLLFVFAFRRLSALKQGEAA